MFALIIAVLMVLQDGYFTHDQRHVGHFKYIVQQYITIKPVLIDIKSARL